MALPAASLLVCGIALWVPLPPAHWRRLCAILLVYAAPTQVTKGWLTRRCGIG